MTYNYENGLAQIFVIEWRLLTHGYTYIISFTFSVSNKPHGHF